MDVNNELHSGVNRAFRPGDFEKGSRRAPRGIDVRLVEERHVRVERGLHQIVEVDERGHVRLQIAMPGQNSDVHKSLDASMALSWK